MTSRPCPRHDELSGYLLGTINDNHAASIAEHVLQCDQCEATMDGLESAADTVVERLRGPRPVDPFAEEAACQQAVQLVEQYGWDPSFTGAMPKEKQSAGEPMDLGSIRVYELLEKIGQGGMGSVYKARHTELDKIVALKILPAEKMEDEAAVGRFKREMKAVGRLDHQHIVRAMDAGVEDGTHYLVMEFVKGVDLSRLARQHGPLHISDACELVRQAALGLQEAHEHNMVHRDIKPSNLMLARRGKQTPQVKILDMGLARLEKAPSLQQRELTTTGQLMGTLDYMAPEQCLDSHEVDIRADIYSLGATLFKLLCGESPFPASQYNSPGKMIVAVANAEPPSIAAKRDGLPAELVTVIDRLLAKQPENRFATPQDVAEALAPFAEDADLPRLLDTALSEEQEATRDTVEDRHAAVPTAGDHSALPEIERTIDLSERRPAQDAAAQSEVLQAAARPGWKLPARAWLALLTAGIGAAIALGMVTLLFLTKHGTIIVEIDDPDKQIEVQVVGEDLVISDRQMEGEPIELRAGQHKLQVSRGDLQFATENFTLRRGEKVVLNVKLVEGQVQVLKSKEDEGESVIAQRSLKDRHFAPSAPTSPSGRFAVDFSDGPAGVSLPVAYQKTEPFTVEMWVTLNGTKDDHFTEMIWSLSDDVTLSRWNRNLVFTAYHGEGKNTTARADYKIELGQRSHVACVSDGSALSIFLNGRLVDRKTLGDPIRRAEKPVLSVLGNLKPLRAQSHAYFNGLIDEFRFSNSARYTTSFTTPPDRFAAGEDTLVLYHFDEGSGEVASDASGNGHHGKIVGGAKWTIIGDGGKSSQPELAVGQPNASLWQPTPKQQAFFEAVAKLPAEKQVPAVIDVLKQANPEYDGELEYEIDGGEVVHVAVHGNKDHQRVTDLWPLAALEQMRSLDCSQTDVANLAPLTRLGALKSLDCSQSPLERLGFAAHLKNLEFIDCTGTHAYDLAPLSGLPLKELRCWFFTAYHDPSSTVIKSLPNLETVNGLPPAELLGRKEEIEKLRQILPAFTPDKRIELVAEKVKKFNPGYKGTLMGTVNKSDHLVVWFSRGSNTHEIIDLSPLHALPELNQVDFSNSSVTDLSPLQGLPLTVLNCGASRVWDLGPLEGMPLEQLSCTGTIISDLTPLREMPLKRLSCGGTRVSDLAPLQDMPLEELLCFRTRVSDLLPLKGMPLKTLDCNQTDVSDLSALQGMPLTDLECSSTRVYDLSPLQGTPLKSLNCCYTRVSDLSPLKGTSLQYIRLDLQLYDSNDEAVLKSLPLEFVSLNSVERMPVAEFWKQVAARRQSAEAFAAKMSVLPPDEQIAAVGARLEELNSGNKTSKPKCVIEDNMVVEARLSPGYYYPDLTPLMAFTKLRRLEVIGGPNRLDISCVKHLPLQELIVSDVIAFKNAPVLKAIETLEMINGRPAGEFWKGMEAADGSPGKLSPLEPLVGHTEPINGLEMLAGGRRLISTSKDKTMRCWDLQTQETIWINDRPATSYYGMAVSPDGLLIAGGKNQSVQILDARTGELVHDIRVADEAYPRGFAFSPDSKTLVAGGNLGHLMVIDVERGKLIEEYQFTDRNEPNINSSIAFHPDGRRYVVAPFSDGGRIYLRQLGREQPLRAFSWSSGYQPTDVAIVGEGRQLAVIGFGPALLYDLETGEELRRADIGNMRLARLSDGTRAIGGSWGGDNSNTLYCVNLETLEVTAQVELPVDASPGVAVSEQLGLIAHTGPGAGNRILFTPLSKLLPSKVAESKSAPSSTAPDGLVKKLTGNQQPVRGVTWLADGQHVISASGKDTVKLWNVDTGEVIREWEHSFGAYLMKAWGDGRKLLTGSYTPRIALWDTTTGKTVRSFSIDGKTPSALEWHYTATKFLSGDDQGEIILWDADTEDRLREFKGHKSGVRALSYVRGGEFVSGDHQGNLVWWNLDTGKEIRRLENVHRYGIQTITPLPGGHRFLSTGGGAEVKLWDAGDGKLLRQFKGHEFSVTSAVIVPGGDHLVTGGDDGTIRVWEIATGNQVHKIDTGGWSARHLDVSPDGRFVVSGGGYRVIKKTETNGDNDLRIWRLPDEIAGTFNARELVGHWDYVKDLEFLPDGRLLSVGWDGVLRLWNPETGEQLQALEGHRNRTVNCVATSGDAKLAATSGSANDVVIWDLGQGQPIHSLKVSGIPTSTTALEFTTNGDHLLVGHGDGLLTTFDAGSGTKLTEMRAHGEAIRDLAILPDGESYITAHGGGKIKLWEFDSEKPKLEFVEPGKHPRQVEVLAGAKRALICGRNQVRQWDLTTGKEVKVYDRLPTTVSIALLPGGAHFLAGCSDKTVRLVNAASGDSVHTWELSTHTNNVLAVDSQGRRFAHGGGSYYGDRFRLVGDDVVYLRDLPSK